MTTASRTIDRWDRAIVAYFEDKVHRLTLESSNSELEVTWFEIRYNSMEYIVHISGLTLDMRTFSHAQIGSAVEQALCMDDHTIALLILVFSMPISQTNGWKHLQELGFPANITFAHTGSIP